MYWNHRVMERVEGNETLFFVVEVYYNTDDNSILGWTEQESVWGESVESLTTTLNWMLEALEKPVLNEAQLLREAEERGPLPEEPVETFMSFEELLDALEADGMDVDEFRQEEE